MRRILLILLTFSLLSCGNRRLSPLLNNIGEVIESEDPLYASSLLDNIDISSISENDLYFLDLLRVRITEKAESIGLEGFYIIDSDSLILPLQEYVEKNPDCGFYSETLYYTGNFYYEIGDSYRALVRYQKALKAMDVGSENSSLRRRILSKYAGVLHSLGKYEKAEESYLEVLKLDSLLTDSLSMIEDRRNLGLIYLNCGYHLRAKKEFEISRKIISQNQIILERHRRFCMDLLYG